MRLYGQNESLTQPRPQKKGINWEGPCEYGTQPSWSGNGHQ